MSIRRPQATGRRWATLLLALSSLVAGCALAPAAPPAGEVAPASFARDDSGLVIGTVSYNYAGAQRARQPWVVHFDRLDRAAQADYALAISVDAENQQGVFTGTLPAGVYAFREADTAERHFAANGVKMPFEVQAGEVKDVGHYALSPVAR